MRLLPVSATYILPYMSATTPWGLLKVAAVKLPLPAPADPVPASVLTVPAGVILRIRLLLESPMYKLPLASMVIPAGPLNEAAVPTPLAEPAVPVPAMVVTTPSGVILRIRLLPLSATYTFPMPSTVSACGWLKDAAAPVP